MCEMLSLSVTDWVPIVFPLLQEQEGVSFLRFIVSVYGAPFIGGAEDQSQGLMHGC